MKKRTISFLLSDYISPTYKDALQIAGKRHDMIGIHVFDPLDQQIPDIGVVLTEDLETKETFWIDTSDKQFRKNHTTYFDEHLKSTKDTFAKSGAQFVSICTTDDYVKKLQVFFKSRK